MGKGESTRQHILEKAAPLFNQRGFAGCSLQDVMDATGLEKGGIYRHFASKEELAAESFKYAATQSKAAKSVGLDPAANAVDQLRQLIARFISTPSGIAGGCPMMNTAIDADDGNPILRRLAHEEIQAWKQRLATIVEQGITRAEIRPDTKPGRIANMIVATLEGSLMLSRLEHTHTPLEDAHLTLEAALDRIAT